jgi:hypothetical protein
MGNLTPAYCWLLPCPAAACCCPAPAVAGESEESGERAPALLLLAAALRLLLLEREAPALHLLLLAAAAADLLETERLPAPAGDRPLLLLPAFWRGVSGELEGERAGAPGAGHTRRKRGRGVRGLESRRHEVRGGAMCVGAAESCRCCAAGGREGVAARWAAGDGDGFEQ